MHLKQELRFISENDLRYGEKFQRRFGHLPPSIVNEYVRFYKSYHNWYLSLPVPELAETLTLRQCEIILSLHKRRRSLCETDYALVAGSGLVEVSSRLTKVGTAVAEHLQKGF